MSLVFVPVSSVADLPEGTMKAFMLHGRRIVVYHTAMGIFASDSACPHRGGPLEEGDLMGNEIVCPWHLWSFDVATGNHDQFPEIRLATHEVRVENGTILVGLPEEPVQ